MRTVAIIQARMSSTRFAGKVLMDLGGLPVVGWCVRAAMAIPGVDAVTVATSDDTSDDVLAKWCDKEKISCVRGPLHDVLTRYVLTARKMEADIVLRLTADCPLLDPQVCAEVLQLLHSTGSDYASNTIPRIWPDGTDCEVFTNAVLMKANAQAASPAEREHVTSYIYNNRNLFKISALPCPLPDLGSQRWTLDTPQDFAFLTAVAQHLPANRAPGYLEVLSVLERNPELRNHTISDLKVSTT